MKNLISLVLFLLFSNSFAQSGWVTQYTSSTKNINDIQFINSLTGFAVADTGTVLKTTNGGQNWINYSINISDPMYRINFVTEVTGYASSLISLGASGWAGKIYKTTTGGINWFELTTNQLVSPTSIAALNPDTVLTSAATFFDPSSQGILYKTFNGGNNFISSNYITPGYYNKAQITSRFSWWIRATIPSPIRYTIMKSSDCGASWNNLSFNGNNSIVTVDFSFINDNTGFVCRSSDFMKTTNGGLNWTTMSAPSATYLSQLQFMNENTGWITYLNSAGSITAISRTTNSGVSWQYYQFNSEGFIRDNMRCYFINENTGWIAGGYFNSPKGCIMKTTTGGVVTGFTQSSSEIPDKFSLSQNYPNPFNPLTRINYELPITNYVSIKVYDALGNEVETLVNEKQNAGSYSVDFNAASLPSGIYFYKLVTEKFSDSKKMVLIK